MNEAHYPGSNGHARRIACPVTTASVFLIEYSRWCTVRLCTFRKPGWHISGCRRLTSACSGLRGWIHWRSHWQTSIRRVEKSEPKLLQERACPRSVDFQTPHSRASSFLQELSQLVEVPYRLHEVTERW